MKSSELFDVRGLVTVVTGGAKGLGRSMGEAMIDNGAQVVLMDVDAKTLDATVADLAGRGEVSGIAVDVTDRRALTNAIDDVAARFGRLDVVFANAGVAAGPGFLDYDRKRHPEGALEAIPDALWDSVLAINLTAAFNTVRAAAPHMKKQKSGRIILTASIAGIRPSTVVGTAYPITKAGVLQLAKQAALELAKYNVLVNAILPGPFLTDLTNPGLKAVFEARAPSHRVADVTEIQGLALFLASQASSYVTGAHIVIDGGATLGPAD